MLVKNTIIPNTQETIPSQEYTTTTIRIPLVNCSKFYYNIDRDICWSARAAQLKDPSLCKRIIQPDVERICSSILLSRKCTSITNSGYRIVCEASLARDPKRCRELFVRDIGVCYMAVAIFNNDTAICDMDRDSDNKALCHALTGSCSQLTGKEDIRLCHQKVMDTIYSIA